MALRMPSHMLGSMPVASTSYTLVAQPAPWRAHRRRRVVMSSAPEPPSSAAGPGSASDTPNPPVSKVGPASSSIKRLSTVRRKARRTPPNPTNGSSAGQLPTSLPLPSSNMLSPGVLQENMEALQKVYEAMSDEERLQFTQALEAEQRRSVRAQFEALPVPMQERLWQAFQDPATNPEQMKRQVLYPMLWDTLRSSMQDADVALLQKLFGQDFPGYGNFTNRQMATAMARLSYSERQALPGVLQRLDGLQSSVAAVQNAYEAQEARTTRLSVARRKRLAVQAAVREGRNPSTIDFDSLLGEGLGQEEQEQEEQESRQRMYGADGIGGGAASGLHASQGVTQGSKGTEQGAPTNSSSNGAGLALSTEGQSASDQQRQRQQQQQPGLDDGDAEEEEEENGDSSLETDISGPSNGVSGSSTGSSPLGAVSDATAERLGKLLGSYQRYAAEGGWSRELGSRTSQYMESLKMLHAELEMLASITPQELQAGGPQALDAYMSRMQAAGSAIEQIVLTQKAISDPAARAVARFIETQLIEADAEEGGFAFNCDPETVGRLGQFVKAAEAWEAYSAFLQLYAARQGLEDLSGVMQAAGMGDDDWWVKLPDLDPAAAPLEATSPEALPPLGKVIVDQAKVDIVSALDPDNLAFMTDLEATGYSEEVLMKWYWHPIIGPRIRSGAFLDPSSSQSLASVMAATLGGADNDSSGFDAAAGGAAMNGDLAETLLSSVLRVSPNQGVPQELRDAMMEALGPMAPSGRSSPRPAVQSVQAPKRSRAVQTPKQRAFLERSTGGRGRQAEP